MQVERISLEKVLRTRWFSPASEVYRLLLQASFCFFFAESLDDTFKAGSFLFYPTSLLAVCLTITQLDL